MSKKTKEAAAPQVQELTAEQEIQVLRQAHEFFGNFNAVPGFAASKWGQALDAIALVANSLIKKAGLLTPEVSEPSEDESDSDAQPSA